MVQRLSEDLPERVKSGQNLESIPLKWRSEVSGNHITFVKVYCIGGGGSGFTDPGAEFGGGGGSGVHILSIRLE